MVGRSVFVCWCVCMFWIIIPYFTAYSEIFFNSNEFIYLFIWFFIKPIHLSGSMNRRQTRCIHRLFPHFHLFFFFHPHPFCFVESKHLTELHTENAIYMNACLQKPTIEKLYTYFSSIFFSARIFRFKTILHILWTKVEHHFINDPIMWHSIEVICHRMAS